MAHLIAIGQGMLTPSYLGLKHNPHLCNQTCSQRAHAVLKTGYDTKGYYENVSLRIFVHTLRELGSYIPRDTPKP